jgi:hypothetical protein
MAGLVPAIHVFNSRLHQDVDASDTDKQSDAVLQTAMRGLDDLSDELKQLEAAQNLADDLKLRQRDLFGRVVGIVGNDFHPCGLGRTQQLQALDDDAFERIADGIKPVR